MTNVEPTKLHRVLGVLEFFVLITIAILDGFQWYTVSYQVMAILAVTFLILIGFGAIVEAWVINR